MALEPAGPFVFASILSLLPQRQQQKESPAFSFGFHNIPALSSCLDMSHNSRCHRKHRSRRHKISKLPLHYLKPGALAQMRDAQKSAARSASNSACCAKKRLLDNRDDHDQADMVLDSAQTLGYDVRRRQSVGFWPGQEPILATSIISPSPATRFPGATRVFGPLCPQRKKLWAPKVPLLQVVAVPAVPITPANALASPTDSNNESYLELLPLNLLVRIVCNLHHDQLKPAFHVSKRLRQAVLIARQFHLDFATSDIKQQDASHRTTGGVAEDLSFNRAQAASSLKQATSRAP